MYIPIKLIGLSREENFAIQINGFKRINKNINLLIVEFYLFL